MGCAPLVHTELMISMGRIYDIGRLRKAGMGRGICLKRTGRLLSGQGCGFSMGLRVHLI